MYVLLCFGYYNFCIYYKDYIYTVQVTIYIYILIINMIWQYIIYMLYIAVIIRFEWIGAIYILYVYVYQEASILLADKKLS